MIFRKAIDVYGTGSRFRDALTLDVQATSTSHALSAGRSISTTLPLSGGGNLTQDRTISIGGLSSLGSSNQIIGTNSGGTGWEYKTISSANTNRVTVTHGAGNISLSGPQDIHTGASPSFEALSTAGTITAGTGSTAVHAFVCEKAVTQVNQIRLGPQNHYNVTVGGRYSGAEAFIAANATQTTHVTDAWVQGSAAWDSYGMFVSGNPSGGGVRFLKANAGVAGTTYATFFTVEIASINKFGQLTIGAANGLAPIITSSSTLCSNLNADKLDGLDSTDFLLKHASGSTPALTAGNWYRILKQGSLTTFGNDSGGGSRATARVQLRDIRSGCHSSVDFIVSVHFGNNPTITVLNRSYYSSEVFSKIRIVEGSTYDGHAVEVYCNVTTTAGQVSYNIFENDHSEGWDILNFEAGELPAGFSAVEADLLTNDAVMGAACQVDAGSQFWVSRSGNVAANSFRANTADTAVIPGFSWKGETNKGLFNAGTNLIGVSIGGSEKFLIGASSIYGSSGGTALSGSFLIKRDAGSLVAPTYAFADDPDTGMWSSASNTIQFVAGGAVRLTLHAATSTFVTPLLCSSTLEVSDVAKFKSTKDSTVRFESTYNGSAWTAGTDSLGTIEFYSSDASSFGAGVVASLKTTVENTAGTDWKFKLGMRNKDTGAFGAVMTVDTYGNGTFAGTLDASGFTVSGVALNTIHRETITVGASGQSAGVAITIPASRSYSIGSNNLLVFLNGILQENGTDYDELNTTQIFFGFDLPEGAVITFVIFKT